MIYDKIPCVNGTSYTSFKIRREIALTELQYGIDDNCTKILENLKK